MILNEPLVHSELTDEGRGHEIGEDLGSIICHVSGEAFLSCDEQTDGDCHSASETGRSVADVRLEKHQRQP